MKYFINLNLSYKNQIYKTIILCIEILFNIYQKYSLINI